MTLKHIFSIVFFSAACVCDLMSGNYPQPSGFLYVQDHGENVVSKDLKDNFIQSFKETENELDIHEKHFRECHCDDVLLCMPLARAQILNPETDNSKLFNKKTSKKEVFAFVLDCTAEIWMKFDWDKLTTIAIAGFYDQQLLCYAHKHGVKVVKIANIGVQDLVDDHARSFWIKTQASDVVLKFLDGINIDFEDEVAEGSPEQLGLTKLMQEMYSIFHRYPMTGLQISFDVAWSAANIDRRFYDYAAIAKYCDRIFIMAYDEQSQIWEGPCTARPNSNIYTTAIGIQSYLDLGIPADKMILGVPWYGYTYPCKLMDENGTCHIESVPFRGCNCSDAAGKEFPYSYVMQTLELYQAEYHWNKESLTPWYNFKDNDSGVYYQTQFDDVRSLMYKYMLAVMTGMSGVGMWTANYLDYSDTPLAAEQRASMWNLLP